MPRIATVALPEVRWTGETMATPEGHERVAVAVYDDDSVSIGRHEVDLSASGPGPDGVSRVVELYVDRAASWDRVRAVLAFLAGPPHAVDEAHLAVARSRDVEGVAYIRLRLGVLSDPPGAVVVSSAGMLDGDDLPVLPLETVPWPWDRSGRPEGFLPRIFAPEDGFGGDALVIDGTVLASPASLGDAAVVSRANAVWARLERRLCGARRGLWWVPLRIQEGAEHVPAAYVVKLIDFAHAQDRLVRDHFAHPLQFEAAVPESLRLREPGSPFPFTVLLAAALGALLALLVSLRCGRPGGRRRSGSLPARRPPSPPQCPPARP